MIEYSIFKAFCLDKNTYLEYNKYINNNYISNNYKHLYKIYNTIIYIYTKLTNNSISKEELESVYISNYPVLKEQDRRELTGLIDRIFSADVSTSILKTTLESHRTRSLAAQLAITSLEVSEGKKSLADLKTAYEGLVKTDAKLDAVEFVTDDLDMIWSEVVDVPGIKWPLSCLNKSLGPLRKGNMGFVFARPEGGKTTFLAHFATNAVTQVDKPILWFNNEQPGYEVKLRLYQAAFGIKTDELLKDRKKYKELYQQKTKGLLLLLDDATIDRGTIEMLCEQHQPSLVIFDQIDKIYGFKKDDRNDLELGNKYQWARELAKAYCPVIGVTQADVSGESVKYLTMANVANAKTSKQAEADWILGIGSNQNDDFKLYRYFNISKNKLLGDKDTNPEDRHGKFQVIIEPEIARYREV
jgi:hypothetical protein